MKTIRTLLCAALVAGFVASFTAQAADNKKEIKPYPLKTCLVSGEKLDAMGEPYVFNHKGQEIKLCCKGCLKSFNKEPEKFLKKLAETPKAK
jgi:YHS domain-containing protein